MSTASVTRWLTPGEIAQQRGVGVSKVLRWIDRGELDAINVAESRDGLRPRWRISPAALAAFDAARSSTTVSAPATPRRRRRDNNDGYVRFFSGGRR